MEISGRIFSCPGGFLFYYGLMRWLLALLIVLATVLPVSAEDWTTADGKTYKNVVVMAQEDDAVRITYTGGVGEIPYYELSPDLQKRFGLDPATMEAKRIAAEKAKADAEAAAAAAAQATPQPAASPQAAAQPGGNPQPAAQPGSSPQPVAQPGANIQPVQPPVNPLVPAAHVENKEPEPYPGSKFSYDEGQDLCYLDSPAVNVLPVLPEAAPTALTSPSQGTLTLRITTDGHQPQVPDQIEATFLSASDIKNLASNRKIQFLVDGAYIPVSEIVSDNGGSSSGAGQSVKSVSFNLWPDQARSIFNAKNVNFSVGNNNYRIDPTGIGIFRKYFDTVDHLPPASFSIAKSYHKMLAQLPSIVTVISTVCEYIILGSFAVVFAATIAAFVLGVSRFMKM